MGFAENYNQVDARLIEWREKYPEGSLQGDYRIHEIGSLTFVAYRAEAYRTPDDPKPGVGTAWERVPGLTNFTENSELQNAETSAWGRALIAVGAADAKKGIATAEDVQWRQAEAEARAAEAEAVGGLRSSIIAAIEKLDEGQKAALKDWLRDENLPAVRRMNQPQCDRVLDWLMTLPHPAAEVPSE